MRQKPINIMEVLASVSMLVKCIPLPFPLVHGNKIFFMTNKGWNIYMRASLTIGEFINPTITWTYFPYNDILTKSFPTLHSELEWYHTPTDKMTQTQTETLRLGVVRHTLRYIPGAVSNIAALQCYLDARPALCVSNIPALQYYLAKVKVSKMNRFNSLQTQSSLGRYAHLWYKATPTYFSTENSNAFYGRTHLSTQHPTTNQHERTRRRRRGKRRLLWRHQWSHPW